MWALLFCGFIAADVAVGVLASRVAFESLLQALGLGLGLGLWLGLGLGLRVRVRVRRA